MSGGGADGRVVGVNGSINPLAVYVMLIAMQADGRTVFDFGCSEGRVLFAAQAALLGARKPLEWKCLKTEDTGFCLTQ